MSSDALHSVEGLDQRVRALSRRVAQHQTIRDRLVADRVKKQAEVQTLSERVEELTQVGELFRVLVDLLVTGQVRTVEVAVTQGLQTVFPELDLQFEAELGTKYNKVSVDFFMRQGTHATAPRGKPLDSFGGGPAAIASFILRVLMIRRLKLFPLLLLDESLSAVGDTFTDNAARFARELAKRLGLDVLLVTHNTTFLDHTDTAYRCDEMLHEDESRSITLHRLARV